MHFGMVSGVGRWVHLIGVMIVEGVTVLGLNWGRRIVTNGDFVAQLCGSA